MELTHNTRRFLKTAAPVIGSAGMLFAVYRWMVNKRGKAVEEQTSVQTQEQGILENLWRYYDVYHCVYQICDDYLENNSMITSQLIDTVNERLTECQSYFRQNKPFIEKAACAAFEKLLDAHEQFVQVIMWDMCEPEGLHAFLRESRNELYERETALIELLQSKLT